LLGAGDARGAFAAMVRGAACAALPRAHAALVREADAAPVHQERQWRQIEPLLETALAEHEQVAARDEDTVDWSQTITARVVLLGGGTSRSRFTTTLFDHLAATIPSSTCELIGGLDHKAPNELLQG